MCDARIMALSYLFPHSSALCECLQAALTVWLLFGYCRAERWAAQWCLQQHLAVNETLHRKVIDRIIQCSDRGSQKGSAHTQMLRPFQ